MAPKVAKTLLTDLFQVLARNDAYGLFAVLDGPIVMGPTLTNLNDFLACLIEGCRE
jgi:hydroxypyruvate reductase